MKKPRFEIWQPDEFGEHRKVTRETWEPKDMIFLHDTTNKFVEMAGSWFDVVDFANEAEAWKQIAMDDSDSLEAAEAFIESNGLTKAWHNYDYETKI